MDLKHASPTAILDCSVYILTTAWGGYFETEKIHCKILSKIENTNYLVLPDS